VTISITPAAATAVQEQVATHLRCRELFNIHAGTSLLLQELIAARKQAKEGLLMLKDHTCNSNDAGRQQTKEESMRSRPTMGILQGIRSESAM
jgi:hypothetical protein